MPHDLDSFRNGQLGRGYSGGSYTDYLQGTMTSSSKPHDSSSYNSRLPTLPSYVSNGAQAAVVGITIIVAPIMVIAMLNKNLGLFVGTLAALIIATTFIGIHEEKKHKASMNAGNVTGCGKLLIAFNELDNVASEKLPACQKIALLAKSKSPQP